MTFAGESFEVGNICHHRRNLGENATRQQHVYKIEFLNMSIIATPQNAVVCHIHFVELLRFNACVITKPYVEISFGDKYR